jgi:hypothetical protein
MSLINWVVFACIETQQENLEPCLPSTTSKVTPLARNRRDPRSSLRFAMTKGDG